MTLSLQKINLSYFRNYDALRLDLSGAKMIVLTGNNGAGKTNLLEAVSLLTPGRGMRGADLVELQDRQEAQMPWAVSAEVNAVDGMCVRLGTGMDRDKKRRIIRINGKDAKKQSELAELISAIWLTPQMDRLFIDGRTQRRRFFDRMVFTYIPDHASRVNRHEKALRERMKLLQGERRADPAWLDSIEVQIAAEAVAIAAARAEFLRHIQSYAAGLKDRQSLFPVPLLGIEGAIEAQVEDMPALELEDRIKASLCANRGLDARTGRTQEGVHRSDLTVLYADKNMPAAHCSTGEQKSLLISITLAHALMMQAEKGFVPLILLDEVAAHLDEARRAQLFTFLEEIDAQVWMTGTDVSLFEPLQGKAVFYTVDGGQVVLQAEGALEAVS